MGEKRGKKKILGSLPFAKRVKNSKKPNLHTCKGGVQIIFFSKQNIHTCTKGVQRRIYTPAANMYPQKGRECAGIVVEN
jgi:hypothetical protein